MDEYDIDEDDMGGDMEDDMSGDDMGYDDMDDDDTEYTIRLENSGEEVLIVIPSAGGVPWNSLQPQESATLGDRKYSIGDLVYV